MQPDNQLPLSLQIYKAHTDWNKLRHEYDTIDSMLDVLKARKVLEFVHDGVAVSKAENLVRGSDWHQDYLTDWAATKRRMLDAQAKHAYLVNMALEQRDEGFNERFAAKL